MLDMKVFKPLRHCVPPPLYFTSQNTEEEFKCNLYHMQKGYLKGGRGENYLHFSSVSRSDIGETPRNGSSEERG